MKNRTTLDCLMDIWKAIILLLIFIIVVLVFTIINDNKKVDNDKEITRCIQNNNYNFRVKGGIVTCLDGGE